MQNKTLQFVITFQINLSISPFDNANKLVLEGSERSEPVARLGRARPKQMARCVGGCEEQANCICTICSAQQCGRVLLCGCDATCCVTLMALTMRSHCTAHRGNDYGHSRHRSSTEDLSAPSKFAGCCRTTGRLGPNWLRTARHTFTPGSAKI